MNKKYVKNLIVLSSLFLVAGVASSCENSPQQPTSGDSTSVKEHDNFSGIGEPPANLGKDGDKYTNTDNNDVYEKQGGVWILVERGPVHQPEYFANEGEPDPSLGEDGDKYTNIINDAEYEKRDGEWVLVKPGVSVYTVTFNLNGGHFSNGETTYPSQTIREGHWVTAPAFEPQKEHSTFLGWFAEGSNSSWNFTGTPVYGDVNLIAQYSVKEEDKLTVTIDPNNGDPKYTVDTFIGDRLYPTVPQKQGYSFSGWFVLSTMTHFSGTVTADLAGDTLIAQWEQGKSNLSYQVEENGEVTIIGLPDIDARTVTVPSTIAGRKVTKISSKAFNNRINIETIYIPDSVRLIEEGAFADTYRLVTIIVDSNNPYYVGVDGILFTKDMKTLVCYPTKAGTTYTVPNSVTRIGAYAFFYTRDLGISNITFNEGLEEIGDYAFYLNETITNIKFPSTLKKIGRSAFYGPTSADDESDYVLPQGVITQSSFNEGLEEIGEMAFANQYFKNEFTLPSSVKVIGAYAFANCTAITKFVVPAGLEVFGDNAFAGATGILDIACNPANTHFKVQDGILYNFEMTKVVMCPSGRTEPVVIPEGVTELGDFSFYMCDELRDYTFPSTLTKIGVQAFAHTYHLNEFTIPDSVTEIGKNCFDLSGVSKVTIGSGLKEIPEDAFIESGLSSIEIPGTIESIGKNAFSLCSRLSSVTFNEGTKSIAYGAFSSTSITSLVLPNSMESIGDSAFSSSKVASLSIGSGLKSIGSTAFVGAVGDKTMCTVQNLTVASENAYFEAKDGILFSKDKSIVYFATGNCGNDGVVTLPEGVTKIADYAFSYCRHITEFNFPSTLLEIAEGAFMYDKFNVTLPNSLKAIGEGAFYFSYAKTLSLGSGVETIGDYAFYLSDITSVTLPNSLKTVGDYAFSKMSGLTYLNLGSGVERVGQFAFADSKYNNKISIPASLVDIGEAAFGSTVSTFGQNSAGFIVDEANSVYSTNGELLMNKDQSVVYAFAAGSTANLVVPETVTEIANYGLSGTGAKATLKSVSLPSSLTKIGDYGLAYLQGVSSLTIPASVTYVGERAFDGYLLSQSIIFRCTEEYAMENFDCDYLTGSNASVGYQG